MCPAESRTVVQRLVLRDIHPGDLFGFDQSKFEQPACLPCTKPQNTRSRRSAEREFQIVKIDKQDHLRWM